MNTNAPLTDAEERPIDRAIQRDDARDRDYEPLDTTIFFANMVEELQAQRRQLWKEMDELRAEKLRLQLLLIRNGIDFSKEQP